MLDMSDLFVYSLESGKSFDLTSDPDDAGIQLTFAWLKDSSRLAVISSYQGTSLDILDVARAQRLVSVKIQNPQYPRICGWSLSPDERYLIFIVSCDVIDKATYVLDLQQKTTALLGNRVDDPLPRTIYGSSYWYGNHTLVAGTHITSPSGQKTTETDQTVAYEWPSGNKIVLDQESLGEWVVNPVVRDTVALTGKDVRIAHFDGQSFTIRAHAPSGGNLKWSPNGKYLAYWNFAEIPSEGELESVYNFSEIVFVETVSGTFSRHIPHFDKGDKSTPVGWLAIP